ncbi:MAG: HD domain-containing phosphohydrolase [Gaiellaceae bacterium]
MKVQVVLNRDFLRFRRIDAPLAVYLTVLVMGAAGMAAALAVSEESFGNPWVVVGLALVAAVSERKRVALPGNLEVSISLLPSLFAAVMYGPLAAMLVGAASFLAQFRSPYLKWVAFTSSRALVWGATGLVVTAVSGLPGSRLGGVILAATAGALLSELLDTANTAVAYRLRGQGDMRSVFRTLTPLALLAVPLFAPVVVLLVLAYEGLSPWTLLLFFVPALGAQQIYALYQEQRQLTEAFAAVNKRLEKANLSFATALVATLDARDRYTAGHSAAVAIYARDIAARLGLTSREQDLVHLCGLVHDIGKIGLPAGILEKPGALTLEERRQIEEHSAIGERILRKVEDYAEIAAIVRHHHERWDGKGYPDGCAGDDIPLLSRIIFAADAYNAMTSDRAYRDAMPSRVARMRLAQSVESQFDTTVVAAFEAILATADEDYRMATRSDFNLDLQAAQYPDSERAAA